jgi:hypothetical protein
MDEWKEGRKWSKEIETVLSSEMRKKRDIKKFHQRFGKDMEVK